MTFRNYLEVLERHKFIFVLITALTVAVALAAAVLRPKEYRATTTLRVATQAFAIDQSVRPDDLSYVDRLLNTYSKLGASDLLVNRLSSELRLVDRPSVSVDPVPNTELVKVSVATSEPRLAARAADRLAELLINEIRRTTSLEIDAAQRRMQARLKQLDGQRVAAQTRLGRLQKIPSPTAATRARIATLTEQVAQDRQAAETVRAEYERYRLTHGERGDAFEFVQRAGVPTASTRTLRTIGIVALVIGLIVASAFVLIIESLSTKLRGRSEIEAFFALPTLATIPSISGRRRLELFAPHSAADEAIRRLAQALIDADGTPRARTILIASAEPEEGKSTIAVNLAQVFGQMGLQVALVDADVRRGALAAFFPGAANGRGLTNVLNGQPLWEQVVHVTSNLTLLPAGTQSDASPHLITATRMAVVLATLSEHHDLVVVDSPALLAASEGLALAAAVDAVILVVREDQVDRDQAAVARDELVRAGAHILGVVLNRATNVKTYDYYRPQSNTALRRIK